MPRWRRAAKLVVFGFPHASNWTDGSSLSGFGGEVVGTLEPDLESAELRRRKGRKPTTWAEIQGQAGCGKEGQRA